MAQKGPGKSYRKSISWMDLMERFPDEQTAERWFARQRWGDKSICPKCGSDNVLASASHPSMPYRCRACSKRFSVRIGSVMQDSKLGYCAWIVAIYIMTTGIKGVSSMKLHRDLGVTQKTAWHLAHRILEAWNHRTDSLFDVPSEVDETYISGKEKNKHEHKKLHAGRGAVGKTAVVGAKDRKTNEIRALVVQRTNAQTLTGFVYDSSKEGSYVFTDDATAYDSLKRFKHQSVKHSVKQYVDGIAHTNSIESFWALLKRGYYGTYHHMSKWQLQRHINEFSGRHNTHRLDTNQQMERIAVGFVGKRLTYHSLRSSNPDRTATST